MSACCTTFLTMLKFNPEKLLDTVVLKIIQPPFPYDFYKNKLCNIVCCVNSMLPINQNMIVSQGLELILSVFRSTTMSGQHQLI